MRNRFAKLGTAVVQLSLTLGLMLLGGGSVFGQSFQKTFGSAGADGANSVIQTADGNLLIAGYTTVGGVRTASMMKIDQSGAIVWQKTYGQANRFNEARIVKQTNDGGYIFAGYTQAVGGGVDTRDFYVVKTDVNGGIGGAGTFSSQLDGGANLYDDTRYNSIIQLNNGNYAFVGVTASAAAAACAGNICYESFAAILAPNGSLVNARSFPFVVGNLDMANSLVELANGNLMVVGRAQSGGNTNGYFVRINPNTLATVGPARIFDVPGASSFEYFTNVVNFQADTVLITGTSNTSPSPNLLALKISNVGNIVPSGAPRGYDLELATGACPGTNSIERDAIAVPTADGGVAMVASSDAAGFGNSDMFFIKTSGVLAPTAAVRIGAAGTDSASSIVQTSAGDFVMVGTTNSFGAGSTDIFVAKFTNTVTCNGGAALACAVALNPTFATATATPVTSNNFSAGNATVASTNFIIDDPCCAAFSVAFTAPAVCESQQTTITITAPNPISNVEFQWDFDFDGTTYNNDSLTTGGFIRSFPVGTQTVAVIANDLINGCLDTFQLDVVVNPAPVFTAMVQDFNVCTGSDATLNATVNVANATYVWTPAGSVNPPNTTQNVTITGGAAGQTTYTVTATNPTTGCTASNTVVVTVVDKPNANAGTDAQICKGASTQLNASSTTSGVTYNWAPVASINGANNIANPTTAALNVATTFTVTVTDGNGCTQTDEVIVSVISANAASVADKSFCSNTTGAAYDATVPGCVGCTYEWKELPAGTVVSSVATFTAAPAGVTQYSVTITANGCSDSKTVTVTPQTPAIVSAGADVTICSGSATDLTASGGVSYVWDPGAIAGATINVNPAADATYTVTGTDANGCTNTDAVTVFVASLSQPNLGAGDTICFGQSVQLYPTGLQQPNETYTWAPNVGFTAPNSPNDVSPFVNPTTTTTYTLTVVNSSNNCSTTAAVIITVTPLPVAVVLGDDFICANEVKQFFATGGDSYQWFDGSNTQIGSSPFIFLNPAATTTYSVIATKNGCPGPATPFTLNVNAVPEPDIQINSPTCQGDPIIVTYTGTRVAGDFADWNFSGGSAINTGIDAFGPYQVSWPNVGSYPVSVEVTANNCVASYSTNAVVRSTPIVSANSNLYYYCTGDPTGVLLLGAVQNISGGPCTYQWQPSAGLNNPFSLTPLAKPTQTTVYTFTSSCLGCSGNQVTVEVQVVNPPVATVDTFVVSYCAGTSIQLKGHGEGAGNLNYEWSPSIGLSDKNSPTPIANPTSDTTYCLTVTDKNGCKSAPACVLVKVIPLPIANAGPDKVVCQGSGLGVYLEGSVTDAAFGSHSFQWEPTDGLSDPTDPITYANPTVTTIYKLRAVNNLTGCSSDNTGLDDVYTVTVKVDEIPIVDAGPNVGICKDETYTMKGVVLTGGLPPYTYKWEPAIGLTDPTDAITDAAPPYSITYYLKAKSSLGCESIADSVRITVNPKPTIEATPRITETICPGESIQLKTLTSGAPGPFYYQWSPAIGLSDPTIAEPIAKPTTTTTYTVIAYNDFDGIPNNGVECASQEPATVLVQVFPTPTVKANPANQKFVLCNKNDAPVKLPATLTNITQEPYTIDWTPGTGLSDSTILNPFAKPDETTDYVISIKTSTCTVTSTVRVTVLPFVEATIFESADTICKGDTVTLIATGGIGAADYAWTSSISPDTLRGKTIQVAPDQSAIYTLIVTEGGCQDKTDILITVLINPEVDFDYTFVDGCQGLTVSFYDKSVFGVDWIWDFGDGSSVSNQQNPSHTYANAGVYTVTLSVRSTDGCLKSGSSSSTINVSEKVVPDFSSVPASGATPVYLFAPIQFTDESKQAVSWLWQFGDSSSSIEQNPSHIYRKAGVYNVTLTVVDKNGCAYTVVKGPYNILPPDLTIPNVFTPNGDGVNDFWKPDYKGNDTYTYSVFDRFGIKIGSGDSSDLGWNGKMGSSEIATGVYFYLVELGERQYKGSFTLLR